MCPIPYLTSMGELALMVWVPSLGSRVELSLVADVWVSQPPHLPGHEHRRAISTPCQLQHSRNLLCSSLGPHIGSAPHLGSTVKLTLVSWVQEIWWAHQIRFYPGTDTGHYVGPPQHLPHLWTAEAYEGAGPIDPKLQGLHDPGQQQKIWEKSRVRTQDWWCSRSQRPPTRPMTHCKEHLQAEICGQRVCWVSPQRPWWDFF